MFTSSQLCDVRRVSNATSNIAYDASIQAYEAISVFNGAICRCMFAEQTSKRVHKQAVLCRTLIEQGPITVPHALLAGCSGLFFS